MKRIFIIGSGQLGSRHLQALKNIDEELDIYIIDPSNNSLDVAKNRYESVNIKDNNILSFERSIKNINKDRIIDIAIIATSSNVRSKVTIDLLNDFKVKTIVFEKILFDKKNDYVIINNLLKKNKVKAYVNCPMRMMSFYRDMKTFFHGSQFKYIVSGSQYGLITNLVHYIDHISYMNGNTDYIADTTLLKNELIKSKRKGFYELNGTFQANFKNGTQGLIHCEPEGNSPVIIQAFNDKVHFISKESEGKVLISKYANNWDWEEIEFEIPFQSELTTKLVKDILKRNDCSLTTYEESMKIHMIHLESLLRFINKNSKNKFVHYPFT